MKILSYIYYLLVSLRMKLYEKGFKKVREIKELDITCIGNITVGGTGKTPAVQYLANEYIKQGKKLAIISRGYKGKRKEDPAIVSDGENILLSPEASGDEAYLHALALRVPVIVGKDRYEACKFAYEKFSVDTIILDDGFQHLKLKRNKNIVLIDATNPFGDYKMLPEGRLREPLSGLKRADEFIITKAKLVSLDKVKEIKEKLKVYGKRIKTANHEASFLYDLNNKKEDLSNINGKKILLFSGLAKPENFEKTVLEYKPFSIKRLDFKDHHDFTEKDIERILNTAKEEKVDFILTTEKDIVKIDKKKLTYKSYVLKIEFKILEE